MNRGISIEFHATSVFRRRDAFRKSAGRGDDNRSPLPLNHTIRRLERSFSLFILHLESVRFSHFEELKLVSGTISRYFEVVKVLDNILFL